MEKGSTMKKGNMSPIERAEAALAEEEARLNSGQQQVPEVPLQQDGHQQHEPNPGHVDEPPAQHQQPVNPPQSQDNPNSETYKARWEVSQGIIRSQSEQLRQAMEQNKHLMEKVETLLERGNASHQPAPAPAMPFQNREELAAEVGEDMAQVIISREAILESKWAARVAKLEEVVSQLGPISEDVKEVKATQVQSESEAFKARLSQRVANWQQVVTDPRFSQWAQGTVEPISGKTYGQLFDQANNVRPWNLEGMVAILNTYLGITGQAQQPGQQQQPEPKPVDPRLGHVAPGARGGGSYTSGNEPPPSIVTEQDYQEAGNLYLRGKMSEADYLKVEKAFFGQNRTR